MKENNELSILNEDYSLIINDIKKYNPMFNIIKKTLPSMIKTTKNFNKTQSQFMDNMLTVSHPTPIRNLRQILAEVEKTKMALNEAMINQKLKDVQIRELKHKLSMKEYKDGFDKEKIEIKILKYQNSLNSAIGYIEGAFRKMTNYAEQYNNILKSLNVKDINEVDFEKEEERYHIMKAFDQALCAARSHSGIIDEGNHIYFSQIGINGTQAQMEMNKYLSEQGKQISEGKEPTHERQVEWLNDMYDKFKGCSSKYAKLKGMSVVSDKALLK